VGGRRDVETQGAVAGVKEQFGGKSGTDGS
jgi:hypothetical protein